MHRDGFIAVEDGVIKYVPVYIDLECPPLNPFPRVDYHSTLYSVRDINLAYSRRRQWGFSKKNPPFRLLIGLFQAWHSASGIFSGRRRAVALLDNVCYLMLGCPFSCLGSLVHHGDLMPQATNGDTYIGKIMRPQGITLSSVFHSEL